VEIVEGEVEREGGRNMERESREETSYFISENSELQLCCMNEQLSKQHTAPMKRA
jgi:hypothetical protein